MPNGNGTGPAGAGPMTGRGAGKCAGNRMPGWKNPGKGAAIQHNGRPRGSFHSHAQHAVAAADALVLQSQIDALHTQLASLEQQLAEIVEKSDN
jgi:hypothetical protein